MANRIVRAIDEIFNDFWKRHRLNLGLAVAAVLMARKVGVGVVGRYSSNGPSRRTGDDSGNVAEGSPERRES